MRGKTKNGIVHAYIRTRIFSKHGRAGLLSQRRHLPRCVGRKQLAVSDAGKGRG